MPLLGCWGKASFQVLLRLWCSDKLFVECSSATFFPFSSLLQIISKDANVVVVTLAAKCVGLLATGLRKKFSQYAPLVTTPILEKFKEKKANVLAALREAIDAIFHTVNIHFICRMLHFDKM